MHAEIAAAGCTLASDAPWSIQVQLSGALTTPPASAEKSDVRRAGGALVHAQAGPGMLACTSSRRHCGTRVAFAAVARAGAPGRGGGCLRVSAPVVTGAARVIVRASECFAKRGAPARSQGDSDPRSSGL